MTIKHFRKWALALPLVLIGAGVALGGVTFDPETGEGFVGKGDVQDAFEWNNKSLQDNAAAVYFQASTVSEVSWVCTNSNNQNTQERERTTTTEGVFSNITRDKKQVTGFILTGYVGSATTSTDGPPLNSCPSGPWSLTSPAGDPEVAGGHGLQVCIAGLGDCKDLE